MKVHEVEVESVESDAAQELSNTFYRNCNFCDKIVLVNNANLKSCLQLSGNGFFCPFCVRNNFHHKLSQNVLIMSFRGIIGYYYKELYQGDFNNKSFKPIWHSEIKNLIELHVVLGLQSPVFYYDPSTYLWFVDFNRIGNGNKRAPINEVKTVAKAILGAFNLNKHIGHQSEGEMWKRFEQAIDIYYRQRKRPKDKRMLIPTLTGICSHHQKESFWEKTRFFYPSSFVVK